MGVHGLTTYLRENKRLLSETRVVPSAESGDSVPVVVDGWSFIFDLYITSNLPWVYGGEYDRFAQLVKDVVKAWISVGFQVYFVFDGAYPDLKLPTVLSRLVQGAVQHSQLFFRTSAASRATGRFLHENRTLPPLAYSTCISALQALRAETNAVEIHFADEEGDPYAVELAGRLAGYVIGKDSDFVIFNSDGYKGYIPFDEMVWHASPCDEQAPVEDEDDDGGFQTVQRPRAKRKVTSESQGSLGLIPPQRTDLSLSFTAFSPETLADHLDIPTTLLPLLGALIGNDFSKDTEASSRRIQSLFFDRSWTLSQRIEKVAKTIQTVISPHRRKANLLVGSVMELIERTVNALLSRLPRTLALGSGEVQSIVDKIVNATLQYAIPKYGGGVPGREGLWSNSVCALHDPEVCTLLPIISRNVMRQARASAAAPNMLLVRERYLDAYRSGLLSPEIMNPLSSAFSLSRMFLENPDLESVSRSIGRPIRVWIFSVLDDTVGLDVQDDKSGSDDDHDDDADEDELIDVVESDEDSGPVDYLAPLKGELHRLHGSDDESTNPPASITPHRRLPTGPSYVTEYFRSGSRIASEKILVRPISEHLSSISLPEFGEDDAPPLALRSEADRLTVLLRALNSDYPTVRRLSPASILPVLAVRWVIHRMHSRFLENSSREREKERWTRNETRCFLAAFPSESHSPSNGSNKEITLFPPIDNRNVQLMAQVLTALDNINQLAQSLLLTTRIHADFHRLSGKIVHGHLTRTIPIEKELPHGIWEAAEEELVNAFQVEEQKPPKKTKGKTTSSAPQGKPNMPNFKASFQLLADVEA